MTGKKATTSRTLWTAVMVMGLGAGCGGSEGMTRVSGRVTDGQGTQAQSLGVEAAQTGGTGTVSATSTVRVSTVSQNGQLTTAAEGRLEAGGRYTFDVPSSSGQFVIQALDASGKVLATSMVEAVAEGETTAAPPMDAETSLEASVFLRMLADKASAEAVNLVDLRARINANMAAAASQGSSSSEAFQTRVKALADAVRAAQQTEVEMYARAGVQTSQTALFQAELSAAASLNAALDAGQPAQAAYETFYAELRTAAERVGATAEQQAQGERAAGASFRATVDVRLSSPDAAPLADAAVRGSASLEARASSAALSAVLTAAGAAENVRQQAATAGTTLRAEVGAAASASVAAQAFARFDASVSGSAGVEGSVLGNFLGVNATNRIAVSTAVQASVAASAVLDTALDAAVSAALTTDAVNVSLLASRTADAYQAYATSVRAQSTVLSAFGARATPGASVLLLAEGSFQLGE